MVQFHCGDCIVSSTWPKYASVNKDMKIAGWRYTKERGWLCPKCNKQYESNKQK